LSNKVRQPQTTVNTLYMVMLEAALYANVMAVIVIISGAVEQLIF